MKTIHYILYAAPALMLGVAAKWPQYWPAMIGLLAVAHVIAINTHKPGAADAIAELEADAAKVKP